MSKMPSVIENIYQSFMADPNFMIGIPEREKKEKAWSLAHERFRQTQRNNVALSMAKEEEIAKESVGTMGPDSGPSKYPAKIGGPTTIENTKKFGQERINLHRDPNRTWRTRPETAFEMTTDKESLEKISPVAAAKKLFEKPPKTLEEKKIERMRRDFGFTKEGKMPLNKQDQFKAYLEKYLMDTLEEEPAEYIHGEDSLDADSEMMSETAITIDTIIDALAELRDNISQHELNEMTGQKRESSFLEDTLEVLESLQKHYTGPGGKHEHLESGQWVRPGMKTIPGKTWGGKKLAKVDFKDLDFKDQDAVMAEKEMFAQGKLKKPVIKPFIPVGGRKNIVSTQKGKPGIFNEQIAASDYEEHPADKLIRQLNRTKNPVKQHIITSTLANKYGVSSHGNPNLPPKSGLEKHEDFTMHDHAGLPEKKYPFLSHILPSAKIKTEPVKKDTSSINEILEVQKKDDGKIKNVFAVATEAAKKAGYSDFSEGSPGKEKRGEIAEALKRKEGIKKETLQKLLFTIKRGKVKSSSAPQHRLLHGRGLDHTHIEGGKYKREKLEKGAQKTLYNVLSNRKYSAPDTLSSAPITTGVTSPQLRVE